MKKASEVFNSIRFAKGKSKDKPHLSTDNEEHYTVGEKEYEQQIKHVKKMAMQEQEDVKEYDYEGEMVKSDLRSIMANAERIINMTEDDENLPEWCQNKITLAEDYVSTVANYLTAEMNEETIISESGGKVVWKKGDYHIEKYGEDVFALYEKGKKQKNYVSMGAAKSAIHENFQQLDELSKTTMSSYKTQAQKTIQQLKPHAEKGEYRDIAKNIMQRRTKGLAAAMKREEVEQLDEKNVPTNPSLWSRAKALARSKFDVYPSAYANGWAAKWYKGKGGGWKSVSEEVKKEEKETPFEPTKEKQKVVPGKHGKGYSTARHLARMAMKKQVEKLKKPVKESLEESRKVEIVKEIMKKKKESEDTFQKDPTLTSQVQKVDNAVT